MEHIINQTHKLLFEKQKTVAAAESCSGGLLSKLLTDISGSSQYFTLGVVAYSNKAKESVLKIPPSIIAENGAVSKKVASIMAKNIRRIANADFGIGVTGIAGPTGGSAQKPVVRLCSPRTLSKAEVPVGTVFIAIESRGKKLCKKFSFTGSRSAIRKKAALKALELLYEDLHRN